LLGIFAIIVFLSIFILFELQTYFRSHKMSSERSAPSFCSALAEYNVSVDEMNRTCKNELIKH